MLDPKEEREYKKLRELGQRLHIPIPEAFWTLEVLDKDGKLLSKHEQRSHSWVRNAYNILFCQLASKMAANSTFGAGLLSLKNTGGAVSYSVTSGPVNYMYNQNLDAASALDGILADSAASDKGIVVGSGTDAESFENYALQTQIAEGVAAGQLSHIQSNTHVITYTAGTKVLKDDLIRYFNNNSGGNVSVNEVGLIIKIRLAGASPISCLHSRDHLASTVTIPDTGQLKVTYTIQLTYAG